MSARDIEIRTEGLLAPICEQFSVTIYDVEYVKEGADFYLRAYIDKEDGVTIDDCENVSRALSAKMDEEDFISDAYILEVSSPGLGRALKKERHFQNSMGEEVEVKTYAPINKSKEFVGQLIDYSDGNITIDTGKGEMVFTKDQIANVKLTIDF